MAELAMGKELETSRWFKREDSLVAAFLDTFRHVSRTSPIEELTVGGSTALAGNHQGGMRVAIFGHPLWVSNPAYLNEQMAERYYEAEATLSKRNQVGSGQVKVFDLWTLERDPASVFGWLNGGD
jgi:hypothetical protein